jgi:hypothetical protein
MGDPNHSYAYAVALLARRDYSTRELRSKLKERGYLENAIEPVLIDLEETASSTTPATAPTSWPRARAAPWAGAHPPGAEAQGRLGRNHRPGPGRGRRGASARFRPAGPSSPNAKIRSGNCQLIGKERARQARFLQYRGFSNDHIRAVLEGTRARLGADAAANRIT